MPGDNSVDLFTNDLGLVVITDPATGQLEGFNLVAGGGMGAQGRAGLACLLLEEPAGGRQQGSRAAGQY